MNKCNIDIISKILLVLLVIGFSISSFDAESSSENFKKQKIGSVWYETVQICDSLSGHAFNRHPDADKIRSSGMFEFPGLNVEFTFQELDQIDNLDIRIHLHNTSRRVIDHYLLMSNNVLNPAIAAVVVTELPLSIFSQEKAFTAVKTFVRTSARRLPVEYTKVEMGNSDGKDYLELFVKNRIGGFCFPTADFKVSSGDNSIQSIGISNYFYKDNKLIELALIVNNIKKLDEVGLIEFARNRMKLFRRGLKI